MPKLREPQVVEEEEKPVVAGQEGFELPTPEPEPQVDENVEEFKRQIEALRQSEATARQQAQQLQAERDQWARYAQERNATAARSQSEATNSRMEAITSGIATANAEIEDAKRAFRMAAIEQDVDAQVEAQSKLAEANANLVNLTNGKVALERAIANHQEQLKQQAAQQAAQQRAQQVQQAQGDQLDQTNLPQTAKTWLRAHPEYLKDPRKNAKIQALHYDVVDEGHEAFSEEYYAALEVKLGMRKAPRQEVADDEVDEQPVRRSVVSAPVSRDAPSSGGQRQGHVRLSAAQREAAKMAGITEAEYAKQLFELNKAKANGSYGGQP